MNFSKDEKYQIQGFCFNVSIISWILSFTEKRGKPTPLGVGWIALYYKNKYI